MSDDRAVQAAAKALSNADGPAFVGSANRRFVAEAAVAAAREVIEAEVRERIAADIEALADSDGTWIGPPDQDGVLRLAARIARGAS